MRTILILCGLLMSFRALAVPQVFACEPEWAALVNEIAGEQVKVYSATTALQDPHRIQARPSLIAAYHKADLLICTGAELEAGWLPALANKGSNPKLLPGQAGYMEVAGLIEMREVPDSIDRSQGDVHPGGNPHIQTDPRNFVPAAKELTKRLSQIDPDHAAMYAAKLADFEQRWQAALTRWQLQAASLKGVSVVSSHRGFPYLYAWLGLREIASLEAKPGVPPGAAHLQQVLKKLTEQPPEQAARMVIYPAYQSDRSSLWLSQHANIPAIQLPYSVGGMAGTADLFGLFDVTIKQLLSGLKDAP